MISKKVAFMSFLPLLGKYFRQIIFSVSMILLSNLCLISCENEVIQTVKEDTEAPKEVSELSYSASESTIILSWKNPYDADFYGVDIKLYKLSSEETAVFAITLAGDSDSRQAYAVSNLESGIQYKVFVRTLDRKMNLSSGVNLTAATSEKVIEQEPLIEEPEHSPDEEDTDTEVSGEKLPLLVVLIPNTEKLTNDSVLIQVNIQSANQINILKWTEGRKSIDYFTDGGVDIKKDDNGLYYFSVTNNGIYTVFTQDNLGNISLSEITITNIKAADILAVTDLRISYDCEIHRASFSWTEPQDIDFNRVCLIYKINDVENIAVVFKGTNNFIPDVYVENNDNISLTAISYDIIGNKSSPIKTSITAEDYYIIKEISLDKKHVEYKSNKTITATITGLNFRLLPKEDDKKLKIIVNGISYGADVISDTLAQVLFIAPDGDDTVDDTVTGQNFIIKIIVDSKEQNISASLLVTSKPKIKQIFLMSSIISSSFDESTKKGYYETSIALIKENAEVFLEYYGENLDISENLELVFYKKNNLETVLSLSINSSQSIAQIKIPNIADTYELRFYEDNIELDTCIELKIYDNPIYSIINFPTININRTGLMDFDLRPTITVFGQNFCQSLISNSYYEISNRIDSSFEIVSDTEFIIKLLCFEQQVGDYPLILHIGSDIISGVLKIRDFSDWTIGDVIMGDGTRLCYDSERTSFTEEQKENAIAVICGYDYNTGVPVGVGIHNTGGGKIKQRMSLTTLTYYEIGTIPNPLSQYNENNFPLGYDNAHTVYFWDYFNFYFSDFIDNLENAFPAIWYTKNYGITYSLPELYVTGWYIPSLNDISPITMSGVVSTIMEMINGDGLDSRFLTSDWDNSTGRCVTAGPGRSPQWERLGPVLVFRKFE